MKIKYIFILILVIELFLQMNRLINKVNYFEINQDVSLEKSIAKSTKQQFSNPQKILVYYNGTSEQSKSIVLNVKEIFNYNKIKLFSKEIGLREIEERDGSFVIKINENVFNVDKLNELIVGNKIKYLGKENAVMVKNLEEFFREFREEE